MKKKTRNDIFLLLFGIVIGSIILEFSAGLLLKVNKLDEKFEHTRDMLNNNDVPLIGSHDSYLGWGFRPGATGQRITTDFSVQYSINSKGLRDKEIPLDKPAEEFRIIALGESTVFGEGVNQSKRFTEVIENSLEKVEVINMGVWGYGADQSLLQLKKDGFSYRPNLVMLFVVFDFLERCRYASRGGVLKPRFILNCDKSDIELQDMQLMGGAIKQAGPIKEKKEVVFVEEKNIFLLKSNLFRLLYRIKKINQLRGLCKTKESRRINSLKNQQKREEAAAGHYDKEDFQRLIYFILREYVSVCHEQGVDFLLVYINPFYDRDGHIGDICSQLGIPMLNLSNNLSKLARSHSLGFKIDRHYNDLTHRVIGEYVSEYLIKKYSLKKNNKYLSEPIFKEHENLN